MVDHPGQAHHSHPDADQQRDEEHPVQGLEFGDEPPNVEAHQTAQSMRAIADHRDESGIDPKHQGHGAARDAGNHICGAHDKTPGDLTQRTFQHGPEPYPLGAAPPVALPRELGLPR